MGHCIEGIVHEAMVVTKAFVSYIEFSINEFERLPNVASRHLALLFVSQN